MSLLSLLVASLYYALPMYGANMAPVLVSRLPVFTKPMDLGATWRGQPLLGSHKTWRGLIAGTLAAVIIVVIQARLSSQSVFFRHLSLVDYDVLQPALLGFLLGFGALLGDAVKSLAKRRFSIPSGQSWVPFDQVDFVVGGLLLSSFYVWPGLVSSCIILLFTPILHIATNVIAYKLGIKSVPW